MTKIKNLKLTEREVSQTLNLKEILGFDVSDMPELRAAFGQAIIDYIVERTEAGVDIYGREFASYDQNYVHSDNFKAFDKTKKVNLTMSGSMLGSMDIIESKGNEIKIGWKDSEENAKAYNHNTGDTVRKRQFFGVSDADLKNLSKEFKPDFNKSKNDQDILNKIELISSFLLE
jgi:hypothetical protein